MATIEPYAAADGTKRYRVRLRVDGKTTSKRGFLTVRDAKRFAAEVEVAKNRGEYVAPSAGRITVGDLAARWLADSVRIKSTTRAARESAWAHRVGPRWAHVTAADVRPSAVRSWVAGMVVEGVGAASIEAALLVLRNALETAVEDRALAINPAAGIKAPRRQQERRGYLTVGQVQRLSDEVGKHRDNDRTAVRFLALTGLRWGELAALRVGSFDMLRRRVTITEAMAEVKGKSVVSSPKTHEKRTVPFPSALAGELAALMVGKGRDDLVFTSPEGDWFRVSTFRTRVFARAVARCQVDDPDFPTVTPHDLRHTAASLAISAGANVKSVQTMLGHASAAMTLDTYADLFPDDLDAVAERLDVVWRAECVQIVSTGAATPTA